MQAEARMRSSISRVTKYHRANFVFATAERRILVGERGGVALERLVKHVCFGLRDGRRLPRERLDKMG